MFSPPEALHNMLLYCVGAFSVALGFGLESPDWFNLQLYGMNAEPGGVHMKEAMYRKPLCSVGPFFPPSSK